MGAYGSPEHLPGKDQEPQYQYGYGKYQNPVVPKAHGALKIWQIILLIVWGAFAAFVGAGILSTANAYSGNKTYGIVTGLIFIALAIVFIIMVSARKKSWPYILAAFVAFFSYFGGMQAPSQATIVPTQSQAGQSSSPATSKPASNISSKLNSSNVVTSSKAERASSKAPTPIDEAMQYKKQCASYKYKSVARNPNDYKGKLAKFTGQVVQVEESWGSDVIRLNVTKDESGIWDDTVYIEYTPKSENESRILENDIISVYGQLNGIKTYTTVLGSDVSIPYLEAQYVEISSESK